MYEVEGKRVKTWSPFKGCEFNCVYCAQRDQAKRQKHRCELCYQYKPHFHPERLNKKFKEGETWFVVANGDISFASFDQFADILEVIHNNPKTTFLIQSKNPAYFLEYLECYGAIRGNAVLGTTIETNWDTFLYLPISEAPPTEHRYSAMVKLKQWNRRYITIEPVFDFDLNILIEWIKEIDPEFVYVGYLNPLWKAKKLQIPEPSLEKTLELVDKLKKITEVRLKTMRKGWEE